MAKYFNKCWPVNATTTQLNYFESCKGWLRPLDSVYSRAVRSKVSSDFPPNAEMCHKLYLMYVHGVFHPPNLFVPSKYCYPRIITVFENDQFWLMADCHFELHRCTSHTHKHTHVCMHAHTHITRTHAHTHIYTNTYTHTQTHTYTHIHTYTHKHTQTQTHTYTHIHTHTYNTQTHTYTNIHTYIYTQTHTHTYIHTYIHTYTHKHTDIYTNTHTHTQTHVHTVRWSPASVESLTAKLLLYQYNSVLPVDCLWRIVHPPISSCQMML